MLEDTFFKKAKVRCRVLAFAPTASPDLLALKERHAGRLLPLSAHPSFSLLLFCSPCRPRATWRAQPTSCWRSSRSTSSSRQAARCGTGCSGLLRWAAVGATRGLGNKADGARVAEPAAQAQPRLAKQLCNRFTCGARLHLLLQVLDLGCHPGAWLQASGGWQCSPAELRRCHRRGLRRCSVSGGTAAPACCMLCRCCTPGWLLADPKSRNKFLPPPAGGLRVARATQEGRAGDWRGPAGDQAARQVL